MEVGPAGRGPQHLARGEETRAGQRHARQDAQTISGERPLMAFNFLAGRNTLRGRRCTLALMAAGVVLVSGCATRPHEPSTSNATTSVTAQTSRAYHGRFAVQYNDQNGQQRNAYGNFSWQETGDTVTVQLRNPFGQTLALIKSS